jgi:hypothetical protein
MDLPPVAVTRNVDKVFHSSGAFAIALLARESASTGGVLGKQAIAG